MPVELWLQCLCREAKPGDELVAVGNHPALGNWDPRASSAILTTDAEAFPQFQLPRPMLLKDGPASCEMHLIEYKYVLAPSRGPTAGTPRSTGVEYCWEDLDAQSNLEDLSDMAWTDFGLDGDAPDFTEQMAQVPGGVWCGGLPGPANRKIAFNSDSLIYRAEHFGQSQPKAESCWPVCPDWAPDVAGGSTVLGPGGWNSSRNPRFELQYRLPMQIFVQDRRSRLVAALGQLQQQLHLPGGLWGQILALVDGPPGA